jgi:steroid delta-isomerase-like uncharacterized protein
MSTEINQRVVRRYYEEILNQGHIEVLEDIAVPDYIENDPLPGQTTGLAGLKQRVEMLRGALNPHFTIEDLVAEGDRVVVRWTQRGEQVRGFLGLPPTGKPFTIAGIDIHRLRDGRMAEHWHVVDQLSLLQQLGVIPQPQGAPA